MPSTAMALPLTGLRLRLLEATANREAARLARERFVQGDGEYLDVLEAERSDYLSRRALSIARTEQRLAVVGIYKALGGGWEACAGRGAVAWLPTIPLQAWHGSATVAPDQPPAFARLPGSRPCGASSGYLANPGSTDCLARITRPCPPYR
ncbi:TolC family protein [Pseudomonas aeruginosa]|nr:TolC family protein [Pseudomonas aeruginosa]